jgi:uncharacterized membrane protein
MSKHKKHHGVHQPNRREQFERAPGGRARVSPTTAVLGLIVLFTAVLIYVVTSHTRGSAQVAATEIASAGTDVTLPIATFSDGKSRFYRYLTASGREVKFFVMRSSDGVIRAAFDACDTCYRERKGYHQDGDDMVCNNCGRRFRSVDVNVLQGGCNPAPVERAVVGDQIVLKAASLELGTTYF